MYDLNTMPKSTSPSPEAMQIDPPSAAGPPSTDANDKYLPVDDDDDDARSSVSVEDVAKSPSAAELLKPRQSTLAKASPRPRRGWLRRLGKTGLKRSARLQASRTS